MERVKRLLGVAKHEASGLAESALLKAEISGLARRRDAALRAIGVRVVERNARGTPVAGFEKDCDEVRRLDGLIEEKRSALANRKTESSAGTPADSAAAS